MQILTGFHAIEERLRSAVSRAAPLPKGTRLLVTGSGPRIKAILLLASSLGLVPQRPAKPELDRLAPDNRGVALQFEEDEGAPEADLESFLAGAGEDALVLVLDHIEDPQNFGAILRSADIFAVDLVIAPKRRSAPLSDATARASAGALAHVPLTLVPNLAEALKRLAKAGFWRYAADMSGEEVASAELPRKCVLVLGNEGQGVSRLLREECDAALSIKQRGHVDSLNVSAAAAILMHEFRRRYPAP